MIALICSVEAEAEGLFDGPASPVSSAGPLSLLRGTVSGRDALLAIGGMGKVNAAHAATLLAQQSPSLVLAFGIGGAYPASGAVVGDIAVAREEIAGDEGVLTREGFRDAEYIGIPLLKTATSVVYSTYRPRAELVDKSLTLLRSARFESSAAVHAGPFVTLSTCTGTKERAAELERRYHGLCENMEGAAVAHIAERHGIPWLEVRGISNIVEDRDLGRWNIPAAVRAVRAAVRALVGGLAA